MSLRKKLDFSQTIGDKFIQLILMDTFQPGVELQVLLHTQEIPEHVKLRANSYLQSDNVKLILNVKTADPSISTSWLVESSQLSNQSRFSRSVWA